MSWSSSPTWGSVIALLSALLAGLVVGSALLYAALPWVAQLGLRLLMRVRYRVLVVGTENLPRSGPVLVVLNHLSWVDGFFLAGFTPRRGKAMVSADIVNRPILRPISLRAGIIPVPFRGPKAIAAALEEGRKALQRGEAVGMFPEGQISRNGLTGPFLRGMERMLDGLDHVRVVPAGLDGVWGSNFSNSGGHFFRKKPKGWRRTVVLAFGPPLPSPVTAFAARVAVQEAMVRARESLGTPADPFQAPDPTLPHWTHPTLGPLTASVADIVQPNLRQPGQKSGTVGLALPGVALRAVDGDATALGPDAVGRLEARVPGQNWVDTGRRGSVDREGFVRIVDA